MKTRSIAGAIAITLCCLAAQPGEAQTGDRAPQMKLNTRRFQVYEPGSLSAPDTRNSGRLGDLIRAGQIYLSLQDAIALALENNLDLEILRYGVRMAETDAYRASGGGTLRGVQLTVNETAAGVGGPGSPLLTSAATGVTPQSNVSVNFSDSQFINSSIGNLAVNGTFAFAAGPAIPLFDPQLSAQLLYQRAESPQAALSSSGTTDFVATTASGNAALVRGFESGATLSAGYQSSFSSQNSIKNLFNPYNTATVGATVTQPLMRGFGKELNRRFITIAKNSERITDYVFQQQVTSTVNGVIRLYTDLVALNEDLKVKEQTLATAKRLFEDNQNKVEQGTIAPIEATRAAAQVAAARQDVINADGFVKQQELILKNVLTRGGVSEPLVHNARIVPTDALSLDALPTEEAADFVALALANRPELQAAKLQVDNAQISLKGTRNGLRPELDLVGSVQNNGLAGPGNPNLTPPVTGGPYTGLGGGYGSAVAQLFKYDYPTVSVGLNLTVPLHNRVAQADAARDEIQLRQTEIRLKQLENQIRVEVEDAVIALQRTRAAYEAATETRKLQEQSLEIEQEKFNVGLSTNFLVIQYQGYVAQARSTEVAALDAYAKAKAQLERAAGLTLTKHNVSIEEAFRGQVSRVSTPPAAVR